VFEAGDERGLVDEPRSGWGAGLDVVVLGASLELAIEREKTLLLDLVRVGAAHVELVAGPELLGSKLLGAPPQAGRDVRAVQAQLLAVPVDTSNDDVRVRMPSVVVVDGCPFDLSPEVTLTVAMRRRT
jgi:hypothetical protein